MSSASSTRGKANLQGLAADLEAALADRLAEVQSVADKVSDERKALDDEKSAMKTLGNVKGSDVIQLNVGGRLFTTKRHTLTQVEGSVLEGMFSGRWDNSFDTDEAGKLFLDLDPDCFAEVLHQLRLLQLTAHGQGDVNWGKVAAPERKEAYFRAMLDFLGLARLPVFAPVFTFFHPSIVRRGEREVSGSTDGHKWAIGETVMEAGTYMWGIKVRSLKSMEGWIFLGVIATTRPMENSFADATSYGWACSGGQTFVRGSNTVGHGGWSGFAEGDDVTMQFNVDSGVLRMKVARLSATVYHITGLAQAPWRVHVNLYGAGDCLELTSAAQF